jgi:mRNA-degrading endonuclease RelE of RelBE toxin-antitoxin system
MEVYFSREAERKLSKYSSTTKNLFLRHLKPLQQRKFKGLTRIANTNLLFKRAGDYRIMLSMSADNQSFVVLDILTHNELKRELDKYRYDSKSS